MENDKQYFLFDYFLIELRFKKIRKKDANLHALTLLTMYDTKSYVFKNQGPEKCVH